MNRSDFYSLAECRDDWSFSEISRKESAELTHAYHQYPAKFIPQLAKALIDEFTNPDDFIWDPFCGSGTLNLEAYRSNRHSLGTDINPVAILISQAKTTQLNPDKLNNYIEKLIRTVEETPIRTRAFYRKHYILNGNEQYLKPWFFDDSLLELCHLLLQIKNFRIGHEYRKFALCTFSSILKKSSRWLTSSIKSQIDPNKTPKKPLYWFKRQISNMKRQNELLFQENIDNDTNVSIWKHNAKHKLKNKIPECDCIITSPPYVVSYDYSELFRLSSYFLFFNPNYELYRRTLIGTPLHKNSKYSFNSLRPEKEDIDRIKETGIRNSLFEYYKDMSVAFTRFKKYIKDQGNLFLIIGDTKLRKVDINNAYFLTRIAKEVGWSVEKLYKRKIPLKILPTYREPELGRFTSANNPNKLKRYNKEYIIQFKAVNN